MNGSRQNGNETDKIFLLQKNKIILYLLCKKDRRTNMVLFGQKEITKRGKSILYRFINYD